MDCRTCTKCCRTLPLDSFQRAGSRGREPACTLADALIAELERAA